VVVRESPLAGSTDEQLWSRAVDEHRIIVTHDQDFPLRSRKDVPAGLILLRPHDCRPSAIDSLFRSFWALISPAELEGQIVSVQPGRFRKRPFRQIRRFQSSQNPLSRTRIAPVVGWVPSFSGKLQNSATAASGLALSSKATKRFSRGCGLLSRECRRLRLASRGRGTWGNRGRCWCRGYDQKLDLQTILVIMAGLRGTAWEGVTNAHQKRYTPPDERRWAKSRT